MEPVVTWFCTTQGFTGGDVGRTTARWNGSSALCLDGPVTENDWEKRTPSVPTSLVPQPQRYIGTIWLAITFPPVSRAARADFQNDIADSPLLPEIRPHPPRDSIPVAAGRQKHPARSEVPEYQIWVYSLGSIVRLCFEMFYLKRPYNSKTTLFLVLTSKSRLSSSNLHHLSVLLLLNDNAIMLQCPPLPLRVLTVRAEQPSVHHDMKGESCS
ncbi:unnamed protein product [Gadus morhua 'NCC']